MNTVYFGAGEPLESGMDVRQVAATAKLFPVAQENFVGALCGLEPVATLEEFTSCLRHASHFTPKATDLNPAARWQLAVYAEDLNSYAAASEVSRQRAEMARERNELNFNSQWRRRKISKRVE